MVAMDDNTWRTEMNARLDSRFFYSSAFARKLIAEGRYGAILFLDEPDNAESVLQAAASGAMNNLSKTLAVEWARVGIRMNQIVSKTVSGGTPEELASLAAMATYLCSDFAAYVTGACVGVNDIPIHETI